MAGSRLSEKYREYGCNDHNVVMLAFATRDSAEEILYGYNRNGCDSVQFGLLTQEGGAEEIGELLGMGGKAGPTFLINPDRTISEKLYYSDYAIDKCFKEAGIEKAECEDTLLAPTVRFVAPKMDEVVPPDSTYKVEWRSRDSDGIASRVLYFSRDNGENWEYVDSTAGADSSFIWTVPDLYSENCRLKLRVYDIKGYSREKISIYFTIPGSVDVTKQLEKLHMVQNFCRVGKNRIRIPYVQRGKITLSDMQGRELKSFLLQADQETYQLPQSLAKGAYVVSLSVKGHCVGSQKIQIR